MSLLQISSARKQYKAQTAFVDVSFVLQASEILGLVGLNGAGKTSLIKSILNLQYVDQGDITLFGYPATNKQSRAQLAYLPERLMPPAFMTGCDYLRFMLEGHGCESSVKTVRQKAAPLLEQLDLTEKVLSRPVKSCSKGMLQKLGIIAVVISDSRMLLLDEPMSGLDPKARMQVRQLLLEQKAQGKSVLFSTHILTDVELLCDRVVIMHASRISFVGTAQACLRQYGGAGIEEAFFNCIQRQDLL